MEHLLSSISPIFTSPLRLFIYDDTPNTLNQTYKTQTQLTRTPTHAPIPPHISRIPHRVNPPRIVKRVPYHYLTRPEEFCPSRLRTPPLYIGYHHAPISVLRFESDQENDVVLLNCAFDLLVSIMEPIDIVGKAKEDASLPKATMTKIIKEMLPPDVRVARDTQDLLIDCCVEFINLISSESNEVCGREDRRTIAPEHVLKALEVLGFGDYIEEVYAAYEQHKLETVDTVKSGKLAIGAEMTEEEALAEQQRMFAEARARMNGVATAPKPPEAESSLNSQLLEEPL